MRTALLCVIAAAAAPAQAPQPHFDVVSVKRTDGDAFATRPDPSRGRFRWTTQLNYLVGYANDVDFSRVSGPSLGTIYSIEATFDPGASDQDVRAMLRTLLAERFHLRTRRISKLVRGYALTVAKGRDHLTRSPEADAPTATRGYVVASSLDGGITQIDGKRGSIAQLAGTLHRILGVPIWDRTALTGQYDFMFRYAATGGDAPALSTALHDLGLSLKKQKGPVESLIIDHIEDPSEN